jgi:hypothetical protein
MKATLWSFSAQTESNACEISHKDIAVMEDGQGSPLSISVSIAASVPLRSLCFSSSSGMPNEQKHAGGQFVDAGGSGEWIIDAGREGAHNHIGELLKVVTDVLGGSPLPAYIE